MYVCLGVWRGLGRVLIKYSGNVRLQILLLLQFTLLIALRSTVFHDYRFLESLCKGV